MDELILTSVEGAIGTITLNRPEALNVFSLDMARQLLAALAALEHDESVRCIVLRGSGRVFSAGGDVTRMSEHVRTGEDRAAYFREPLRTFGEVVLALRRTPRPVLAAVHGAVAGVGFNVMLACDLIVAAETTRFTEAFIRIGLSPDGGGTWFLPRMIGHARASELTLLPTELDAATAQSWGLVNWTVPDHELEEKTGEIAAKLARGPLEAMARTKALLDASSGRGLAEQIEAERMAQIANAASPEFEEGLAAFLEKRAPAFERRRPSE